MMKKLISLALITSITATTIPAMSQTVKKLPPAENAELITPLKKFAPAPFEGILLSVAAASKYAAELEGKDALIKAERKNATQLETAKCDKDKADIATRNDTSTKILKAQLISSDAKLKVVEASLATAEKAAKKPDTYIVAALGVVGGVLATIGTIFLVGKVTK